MALAPGEVRLDELTETLRRTPVAMAVVDLSSNRLTLVNDAWAALLRLDASEVVGLDLLSLVSREERGVIERVLAGLASGLIDSTQGRGRLHSPGGHAVDVVGSMRSLDTTVPHTRCLLVAAPAKGAPVGDPGFAVYDSRRVAFGAVDHDWRFTEMSADAAQLLDWDFHNSRGTPLQALVHPDDVSLLLVALGRSSADRRATATRVRVRGRDGDWTPVRLAVSPLCDHNPPRLAVAFGWLPPREDGQCPDDRASRLEGHLWRIALELQAAGINDPPRSGRGWPADPVLSGLSRRQSEVLRRLTRGERISGIARDLFVSQSTVRNHLSAIYRRLGVHSQSELLARLMPPREAASEDGLAALRGASRP
jgi:DNA-binding CsgD family transcriptional regulator